MASSDELPAISDQAVLIYTWITYGIICQIIHIFGIATNIINIICFVKQGFDDSVNVSLLGLSISDLGSLIAMIWSCICVTPAVAAADLPFVPLEISYLVSAMPHLAFARVSGCITAMITLERCLCITAPLQIKHIITTKRLTVTTVCIFTIFFCSGFPVYLVNSLGMTFSVSRNKSLYGLVSTGDRESVEKLSFTINNFFIPFGAFVIIVVCTAILSVKLRSSIKWRQKTVNSSHVDRVSNRHQKTAKMVVMISTLFIVCFIPVNGIMLALGLVPSLSINGKHMSISVFICGLGYIMENINSSMNIFIYYHMSSKYREHLQKLFMLNIKRA